MTTPRLLDFFTLEADEYLSRLDASVRRPGGGGRPDFREMEAAARGLRGSATMARVRPIADLASRLEALAGRLARGELRPAPPLPGIVQSTMETLAALVRAARNWSRADNDRARAALAEIEPYAPGATREPEDEIVPVSELFYADAGPHILEVAATARTTFEQRLREGQVPAYATHPSSEPQAVTPPVARARRGTTRTAGGAGLRGAALADLLGSSVATMRSLEDASEVSASGGVVPIEALLYRGKRAVSRAAELRAQIQNASTPPSRELFAELCDLVELAATE